MSGIPTWEECAAAGMTQADAARARGMSRAAACNAAKRLGLTFADGWRDERALARLRRANHWQVRWAVCNLSPEERAHYDQLRKLGMTYMEAIQLLAAAEACAQIAANPEAALP